MLDANSNPCNRSHGCLYHLWIIDFNTIFGKRETDIMFKLKQTVRGRIYKFVVSLNGKVPKKSKTFDIIGCSPEFLKEHLEKQFTEGMSWDLMGQYIHIDHILPLSLAKNEEDMYKLCHYTNLQPLWAFDNLSKGSKVDV